MRSRWGFGIHVYAEASFYAQADGQVSQEKGNELQGSVRTHSQAGSEGAVTQERDFAGRPGLKLH